MPDIRREAAISDPFHVLILVENLPVPFDRRVWQEAQALASAGYEVSVICPTGKGFTKTYEFLDGVHIYRHPLREADSTLGYLREYATALFHELRLSFKVRKRRRIDAIQACNPPDLLFLVALVHKALFGTRFVFDHHDLAPELYVAKFGRHDLFHKALSLFERLTFRTADASIATNEVFRGLAISRGGMKPGDVTVVKSYPDANKFRRQQPDPKLKALGKKLVGYVGIMGEQDGVDLLVEAMADIVHKRRRSDIHCVIVGDGPELGRLKALATRLDVADAVNFTGYLSGPALMANLSALDVGVIPDPSNAFNDKLSMNKVFEYMMLGLPFVQFNLKQAALEAEGASLVVQENTPAALAGGIVELVDSPELCESMSAVGLDTAQRKFRWSVEQRGYLNAYARLFDREQHPNDQRDHPTSRPGRGSDPVSQIPQRSASPERVG